MAAMRVISRIFSAIFLQEHASAFVNQFVVGSLNRIGQISQSFVSSSNIGLSISVERGLAIY